MKDYICTITGVLGSAMTAFFGGWSAGMTTLFVFMCIDYISGMVVAGVFKKSRKTDSGALESRAGFKGLCRKGIMILVVVFAYHLDMLIKTDYIRDAVVIGFCLNEAISITENIGLMGIPLPKVITKAIDALNRKGDE